MNKINKLLNLLSSLYINIISKNDIYIISESSNWVIKEFSNYLKKSLKKKHNLGVGISYTPLFLKNKVIHFTSVGTFVKEDGVINLHPSNKVILTWFHVEKNDKRLKFIDQINKRVDIIHTSCTITKKVLIKNGIDSKKVIVVPLGIDTNLFVSCDKNKKIDIKKELNISDKKIIIGSFQKDGVGWSDGFVPKLVKGPDIFCDVIENLSKEYDIHIMLTGPARGYVKNRLKKADISYSHNYLKNYTDIVKYYNVLDLYIIASRIEGGPMALLETASCNVSLVTTKVGMAPDIIDNGVNGLISDVNDVNSLIDNAKRLINDQNLKSTLICNAHKKVKQLDWDILVSQYFNDIYSKLLK